MGQESNQSDKRLPRPLYRRISVYRLARLLQGVIGLFDGEDIRPDDVMPRGVARLTEAGCLTACLFAGYLPRRHDRSTSSHSTWLGSVGPTVRHGRRDDVEPGGSPAPARSGISHLVS